MSGSEPKSLMAITNATACGHSPGMRPQTSVFMGGLALILAACGGIVGIGDDIKEGVDGGQAADGARDSGAYDAGSPNLDAAENDESFAHDAGSTADVRPPPTRGDGVVLCPYGVPDDGGAPEDAASRTYRRRSRRTARSCTT